MTLLPDFKRRDVLHAALEHYARTYLRALDLWSPAFSRRSAQRLLAAESGMEAVLDALTVTR